MAVDLHSHSTVSDGSFSPSGLARVFAANDITVAALTDHDGAGGRNEFLSVCEKVHIVGIAGMEFSTILDDGTETHILCYGPPWDNPQFQAFLEGHHAYLRERVRKTLDLLAYFGYKIDIEDVYRISRGNPPMPPHILRALFRKDIVNNLGEAVRFFMEFLATNAKAWVPHETRAEYVIENINRVGAVPIISHPARYPGIERLEDLLDAGARGFELYYPEQTGDLFRRLKGIAEKHDCLVTGGCDFHGAFAERKIKEVNVPLEAADKLFSAIGLDLSEMISKVAGVTG